LLSIHEDLGLTLITKQTIKERKPNHIHHWQINYRNYCLFHLRRK
jgi:hypothetical protein